MWEKLEQIARRCAEIGELLTVPEIYGDAKELRRLTQEQKELEPVAQCYEDYRRAERTIAEATELLSDAELRDMAQEELRQAKADADALGTALRQAESRIILSESQTVILWTILWQGKVWTRHVQRWLVTGFIPMWQQE